MWFYQVEAPVFSLIMIISFLCLHVGATECKSDIDCSLNGMCTNGRCECDSGWTGPGCAQLDLVPIGPSSGYRNASTSTWGGNIVPWGGSGGQTQYHMWIAEFTDSCGLTSWRANSQVTHVVSSNPEGPYSRQGIAVPPWSHNPSVIAPLGSTGPLVMFHIGDGTPKPETVKCGGANATSPCGVLCPCIPLPEGQNCKVFGSAPGYTCYEGHCGGDKPPALTSTGTKAGDDSDAAATCGDSMSEPHPYHGCSHWTPGVCAEVAAGLCNSTSGCKSFAFSTDWLPLEPVQVKLYSGGSGSLAPNVQWATWLRNNGTDGAEAGASRGAGRGGAEESEDADGGQGGLWKAAADGSGLYQFPVSVAQSVEGPWTSMMLNATFQGANNPAPWVAPNGTVFLLLDGGVLARADSWNSTYQQVTTGACGPGEDPFLYTDAKGRFHCVFHSDPYGEPELAIGHAFSQDGFEWHVGTLPAAGSIINVTGMGEVPFGKRERPHLFFDSAGNPTQLVTGVAIDPACDPFDHRPGQGLKGPDSGVNCTADAQHYRIRYNYSPGWMDRSYTLVQSIVQ